MSKNFTSFISLKIIIILFILKAILAFEVGLRLKKNEFKCIGEYLTEGNLSLFDVYSDNSDISLKLVDTMANTAYKNQGKSFYKFSFTAKITGNHQLCFSNYEVDNTLIRVTIKTGVDAQDYTEIAKKEGCKRCSMFSLEVFIK